MILVTGANGQLGTELRHLLDERTKSMQQQMWQKWTSQNAEKVDEVFAEVKPTLVYHCAAYTAVDAAEDEGKELDYAINVTGTEMQQKRLKSTVQPWSISQRTTFLMGKTSGTRMGSRRSTRSSN